MVAEASRLVRANVQLSFVDLDAVIARAASRWRPPSRLSLSQWADRYFVLSSESAATPGRWKTLPYQRGIMDAMTDPGIEEVTLLKSARIGYTLMMSAAVGYWMHQDPSSMLIVQPTVDDAKGYSKETIAPMLRDVPVLADLMMTEIDDPEEQRVGQRARRRKRRGPKDKSDTIRHKAFPGGFLSLVGANSGTGFRRTSRRIVLYDEIDAYPSSAGIEGDPISLGAKRTEAFYNRKLVHGSTPLNESTSRIKRKFEAGDQRHYYVPCPQCGHMDFLSPKERSDGRGHWLKWDEGNPEGAYFICRANGCIIEHHRKRWMVERGDWRAHRPGGRHASFVIWAAYSYSPNATWGHIATRFCRAVASGDIEELKTVINTDFAETWVDRGEAPEWEHLYARRELYPIGTVPAGVILITAGVDVQKDRFVVEVVGWTPTKRSYSIDAFEIYGDTADDATWGLLDNLLDRRFPGPGGDRTIDCMAVDSGYRTQETYTWVRRHPRNRVIATKGVKSARNVLGSPSKVDVTIRGRKLARGARMWPIGTDIAKTELYGWLGLRIAAGAEPPPGYCHFPEHGEEYFRQLTAEHLVVTRQRSRHTVMKWEIQPNRQNHYLDARICARAAAAARGLDRMRRPPREPSAPTAPPAAPAPAIDEPARTGPPATPPAPISPTRPGWLSGGGRLRPSGGGFWGRRR